MTIAFMYDGISITSNKLGSLYSSSLMLYHVAKLLSCHPENQNMKETFRRDGARVLSFDYYAENVE